MGNVNQCKENLNVVTGEDLVVGDGDPIGGGREVVDDLTPAIPEGAPKPQEGPEAMYNKPLKDLVAKYRPYVDQLQHKLKGVENLPYDHVLLRYLFATRFENDIVGKAAELVLESVEQRKIWALTLGKAEKGEVLPQEAHIRKCMLYYRLPGVSDGKPPMFIIRSGMSKVTDMMNGVTHEEMVEWIVWRHHQEWCHTMEMQKETGLFKFWITINDFQDVSLLQQEPRFFKALGEANKVTQALMPVVTGKAGMINFGTIISGLFALSQAFMPARALAKIGWCRTKNAAADDFDRCPYCKMMNLKREDVPDFLGGTHKLPDSPWHVFPPEKLIDTSSSI